MSGDYQWIDIMEPRQLIVKIIREKYEKAQEDFRHAHAERVGLDAACNVWDDLNKEDGIGGISQNPYATQARTAALRESNLQTFVSHMKRAYDCAVDTFLKDEG